MSADAAARARAAYLRQELTAPAAALAEYARALAEKAADLPADDRATAERLADRAKGLEALIDQVTASSTGETGSGFGPPLPAPAGAGGESVRGQSDREYWRGVRHDLRATASFVIMAADDLAEGAPGRLDPELALTRNAAARALELIDQVVRFGQGGAGTVSEGVRAMLARLPRAVGPTADLATGRVLLVDDNEFGRDLLARMLAHQGHTVEVAASGAEAQARLLGAGPAIDLVLLDVMMPGMTGPEVLAWLKADPRFWAVPVIMVSALGEDDSVLACIAAGAEDYLTRPVKPELLHARIAGCLEKKRLRDREAGYQARIDQLVRAIFPAAVVSEWQETGTIRPRMVENVGVLFLDVVGFTAFAERYRDDPAHVVSLLQDLIERYEATTARHGVQKIKTIGDAFMGAVGLSTPVPDPAAVLVRCGLDLIADTARGAAGWQVRVGVHVGPVVTGVLGKTQFSFDVWGHTVNAASRTESNGVPGRVTLSDEAWAELRDAADAEPRDVAARGLGQVRVWDFAGWRAGS